ncbi:hypothetical protein ACSFXN_16140 [Planococcus sp. 1R117A]|uniref:hypothetical protein n=1 Tax=Planococcus sp. 1R117A TaxID=3447020 RepID=UPI003EDC126C
MTQPPSAQFPLLAWFVLIIGAFFFVSMLPIFFMTVILPIWRPEEFSFVSVIILLIAAGFMAIAWRMMKWAKQEMKTAGRQKKEMSLPPEERPSLLLPEEVPDKKPIWPWLVIAPGALLLISAGPGAVMFPIMPLFLAGMSTDSETVPEYVPLLIILIGYGVMGGYVYWLFRAIKALRKT